MRCRTFEAVPVLEFNPVNILLVLREWFMGSRRNKTTPTPCQHMEVIINVFDAKTLAANRIVNLLSTKNTFIGTYAALRFALAPEEPAFLHQ